MSSYYSYVYLQSGTAGPYAPPLATLPSAPHVPHLPQNLHPLLFFPSLHALDFLPIPAFSHFPGRMGKQSTPATSLSSHPSSLPPSPGNPPAPPASLNSLRVPRPVPSCSAGALSSPTQVEVQCLRELPCFLYFGTYGATVARARISGTPPLHRHHISAVTLQPPPPLSSTLVRAFPAAAAFKQAFVTSGWVPPRISNALQTTPSTAQRVTVK